MVTASAVARNAISREYWAPTTIRAGLRLDSERGSQADPAKRARGAQEGGIDQGGVVGVRILHPVRADDRDQDQEDDDDAAAHRDLVPAQPQPGNLPERPPDDVLGRDRQPRLGPRTSGACRDVNGHSHRETYLLLGL